MGRGHTTILRQNYASVRWILCPSDDLPADIKDLFANGVKCILREANKELEKALIKRWNVPTVIISIVKSYWLDLEKETERNGAVAANTALFWNSYPLHGNNRIQEKCIEMFHKVWWTRSDRMIIARNEPRL